MAGSVLNNNATLMSPASKACNVSGPSSVEPYELPKMEAVSPPQPGQAINALGALGRAAEHQARRPSGQVGDRVQAISGRGGGGHHDDVGVLRARRVSGDEPLASGPPGQARWSPSY